MLVRKTTSWNRKYPVAVDTKPHSQYRSVPNSTDSRLDRVPVPQCQRQFTSREYLRFSPKVVLECREALHVLLSVTEQR
jgi:hypothetical protein